MWGQVAEGVSGGMRVLSDAVAAPIPTGVIQGRRPSLTPKRDTNNASRRVTSCTNKVSQASQSRPMKGRRFRFSFFPS